METLAAINFVDIFLHLDKTLETVIQQYQAWVYLILFAVIFCETGFVVAPFCRAIRCCLRQGRLPRCTTTFSMSGLCIRFYAVLR
jgi:hypothetical protein